MIKFKPREIGIINNPVMIIGLCPGRQRKKDSNQEVFYGNKTGDFIEELIKDKDNLYLTNVFNYYSKEKIPEETITQGTLELIDDIKRLKPRKIACLGNFSYNAVKKIAENLDFEVKVYKMLHPSFVIRFNKDKAKYRNELLKLL